MGLIGKALGLYRTARENSEAWDAAVAAYEAGETAPVILKAFSERTDAPLDDAAARAIVATVGAASNTLYNVAQILYGIAHELDALHVSASDLEHRPLRELLGDKGTR